MHVCSDVPNLNNDNTSIGSDASFDERCVGSFEDTDNSSDASEVKITVLCSIQTVPSLMLARARFLIISGSLISTLLSEGFR